MEQDGQIETASVSRSFRMGAEFLTYELVHQLAKEVTERTAFCLMPDSRKAEKCPLSCLQEAWYLLHEAIGHALRSRFYQKK